MWLWPVIPDLFRFRTEETHPDLAKVVAPMGSPCRRVHEELSPIVTGVCSSVYLQRRKKERGKGGKGREGELTLVGHLPTPRQRVHWGPLGSHLRGRELLPKQ